MSSPNRKLLHHFGLKWNPFGIDAPVEALRVSPSVDHFSWRIDELARTGGFALISGNSGTGKSTTLRILENKLQEIRDISVATITRPQSSVADFYRELGDVFAAGIRAGNRWGGFKMLREKWKAKLESSLRRPVLLIDEAQEMQTAVLSEIRLLSSEDLDSKMLLTVILAGDGRLLDRLDHPDLAPLNSRIKARLNLGSIEAETLLECLDHALEMAGNTSVMSEELRRTLAEQAAGNWRTLMNLGDALLTEGLKRDLHTIEDDLYFEVFAQKRPRKRKRRAASSL